MRNFWPIFLASAACSGGGGTEYRQPKIVQPFIPPDHTARPEPDKSAPRPAPLLMAGDLLRITVYRQPDLDLEVRILDTGMITYPLIRAVQAGGQPAPPLPGTPPDRLLKDYPQKPSLNVTAKG